MFACQLDEITASLEKTNVSLSGVSFKGKSLSLNSKEDAKDVAEEIDKCKSLEYLNLEGNSLGVDAAEKISEALEKHPEFKRALWKDMFTGRLKTEIPKALEFLGNSILKSNAKLVELDLSDNAFGPIGVEGLAALLKSSSCYSLQELRLNNNGLGITGGKLLANALLDCYNSSKNEGKPLALKVFIAGRNRLENDGATALAKVFKTLGSLEEIVMPQNGIYHVGISALSDAFTYNKNLTFLNLNDNTIGLKGVQAFVKALPSLQKLKLINFGDCLLKTEGAILLAQNLQAGHIDLEELILGFNEIKSEGGMALAAAMQNKVHLRSLILDGNQFGTSGKIQIENKMKDIGKYNTLDSMDENESEGENSEDKEESEESSESESEPENVESPKAEPYTICDPKIFDVESFIISPTAENFLNLGENKAERIIKEIEQSDNAIESLIPIIMKVSSLSKNNKPEISKASIECAEKLYEKLFEWAQQQDKISITNNSLLIHLELIKSEDKTFKTTWNVEGCLFAIETLLKNKVIPESTKLTLKTFLERQVPLKCNPDIELAKKRLLSILK